jgi:protein-(glutamine-N5) methyltransferase, release factor-specific
MNELELWKLKHHYVSLLEPSVGRAEAGQMVRVLIEEWLGIDRVMMALNPAMLLTSEQKSKLDKAVEQLSLHKPLQYVLGFANFMGMTFRVDENVLIPRPETEEMVQTIIRSYDSVEKPKRIWDIGTGSGCIAISLAKAFPNADVFAFDISDNALEIASENAKSNAVKVRFIHDDIFLPQSIALHQKVDLIVSNPPYVRECERVEMKANVVDYEPNKALFVSDDDPLIYYREILITANKYLDIKGAIWFEINEFMEDQMRKLCRVYDFANVEIMRDFREKMRFCTAKFN